MTLFYTTLHKNWSHSSRVGDQRIVYEFFKTKDINAALDLFADDAIVYEPFSKIDVGLKGKDLIKPFLDVVMMENDGMRAKIVL